MLLPVGPNGTITVSIVVLVTGRGWPKETFRVYAPEEAYAKEATRMSYDTPGVTPLKLIFSAPPALPPSARASRTPVELYKETTASRAAAGVSETVSRPLLVAGAVTE